MEQEDERENSRRTIAGAVSTLLNLLLTLTTLGLAFITWQEAVAHGRRMDDWHRDAAGERRLIRKNGELMLEALNRSPEELKRVVEVIAKQQAGTRMAPNRKRPVPQRQVPTEAPTFDYRPLPLFDR